MATYLLLWNPAKRPKAIPDVEVERVRKKGYAESNWSVGNSWKPSSKDRFFLMKLGETPKGLIGSGIITSSPWRSRYLEKPQTPANFVKIQYDVLRRNPIITEDELMNDRRLSLQDWFPRQSGRTIDPVVAAHLEKIWSQRTAKRSTTAPPSSRFIIGEEVLDSGALEEGRAEQVLVNRYERDSRLRRRCLKIHGYSCQVCGRSMAEQYGSIAAKLIHVHHLRPPSRIKRRHRVDPRRDLVPVCPNCHAVIHLGPPYTVAQVQQFLKVHRAD